MGNPGCTPLNQGLTRTLLKPLYYIWVIYKCERIYIRSWTLVIFNILLIRSLLNLKPWLCSLFVYPEKPRRGKYEYLWSTTFYIAGFLQFIPPAIFTLHSSSVFIFRTFLLHSPVLKFHIFLKNNACISSYISLSFHFFKL